MSETKLYEQLGRKQSALDDLGEAYNALLRLLAGVVSGDIDRSRVLVNLTARSWAVTEPGTRPSMPAMINGQPECVVAPEECHPTLNGRLTTSI